MKIEYLLSTNYHFDGQTDRRRFPLLLLLTEPKISYREIPKVEDRMEAKKPMRNIISVHPSLAAW